MYRLRIISIKHILSAPVEGDGSITSSPCPSVYSVLRVHSQDWFSSFPPSVINWYHIWNQMHGVIFIVLELYPFTNVQWLSAQFCVSMPFIKLASNKCYKLQHNVFFSSKQWSSLKLGCVTFIVFAFPLLAQIWKKNKTENNQNP